MAESISAEGVIPAKRVSPIAIVIGEVPGKQENALRCGSTPSPSAILVRVRGILGGRPPQPSIQNNSDLAQGLFQFAPLKSDVATSIWRQEGYMAPKPKPAIEFTVGMVLAMALTILVVMTWAVAAPSSSAIYHPQLLLLY